MLSKGTEKNGNIITSLLSRKPDKHDKHHEKLLQFTYNMDVSVKCENLGGRTPVGRVRNKWDDNIKTSLKKT